MKKIKLLLAAMAAMVGLSMNAQEDITSTYLTNADLSTVNNGWAYYSDTYKYQTWRTGGEGYTAAVEFYAGWGSLEHTDFAFKQTITLPAGNYRIAVNAFYREGNNGDGTNNNKAWIFAGDKKQNVHALNSQSEVAAYDHGNGDDMNDAMYAFGAGAFQNAFDFDLTEEQEITLGFQGKFDAMRSWCILGPVKLYRYSLDDYLKDYDTKYEEAEAISGKMNNDIQTALKAAMVDRNSFRLTSEVTAAIATLTTAINNANASIAYYSSLKSYIESVDAKTTLFDSYGTNAYNAAAADAKAAYNNGTATDGTAEKTAMDAAYKAGVLATKQPDNGMDMTPYITNSNFDTGNTNGWTKVTPYGGNCQIQDGSRMEYWAGNASDRAQASFDIYQEIENLPAGVYTISADMYNSLNNEGGSYTVFSPTCGVYGSSSNEEVALVTEEGTTLKTYTTDEVLYFRGKLRIGTKNTITPMAARWFLFDNVKLTYARQLTAEELAANTLPESISVEPTSDNLTIYGTTTLVATVLPDNANDKSVSWSSSDETVATVVDGVVTAVGVGSAIITATANGADGVSTTASITVNDVTPVAAPAFYSEIAAGDFYIVNAATGKYLGGANNWGTHASLIEHAIPITVAFNDDKYTFDTHISNGGDSHYFGGEWMDGGKTSLYISSVGNGKYSISTGNSSAFVTAHVGNTLVANDGVNASSTLAQWYFLSKKDFDKMLAAATEDNPVDATYYIKDANFGRNYTLTGWPESFNRGGNNENMNAMVQNAAANVFQTIDNIPNGTYTLKVQAVTSGAAKFYANDVEQDIESKDDVTDQATASNAFGAGFFKRELSVTVTDRTLKIGVKSDDTDKTLYFDNFELFMTGYTANTGISASIDKNQFEVDQTAQITAATDPATASFNKLIYSSSNEEVATVDANGVVTGVAVGTATITITADEMENFSETIDVEVTYTSATAEDYAALNKAIEDAEAKVLGFDEGEYAPYNNIEAIAALAAAKAIDQEVPNTQISVQAATAALTGAAWTANTSEVNGFYDGFFTIQTVPASNTKPLGWNRNSATAKSTGYEDTGYATRIVTIPSGVTASNVGMMTKQHAFYGDQENYTLPLKANTYYTMTFKYAGYNDKPTVHINVYDENGTKVAGSSSFTTKDNKGHEQSSSWSEYSYIFKTTVAGNYVIGIIKDSGATEQKQIVVTDLNLVKNPIVDVTMSVTDAKYATFIAPFDVNLDDIDGVSAYGVSAADGNSLTLSPVETTIPANTPVILNSETIVNEVVSGQNIATSDSYTVGWLTGVYNATPAPVDSYVLQKNNEKVGFYQVAEGEQPTVGANRAYLTVPGQQNVKAFFFGDVETTIQSVFDGVAAGEVYDLNGRKVVKMQKGGAYIVNGKKVIIK